jgi:transcriptional regulator with XRE-family HTH domain
MKATVEIPDGPQGFIARVRTCRILLGCLSQREFGDRAGLTKQAISALERGEIKVPSAATLFSLADAIGTTAAWLWKGEGRTPSLLKSDGYDLFYQAGHAAGLIDAPAEPPVAFNERARGWWMLGHERALAERSAQASPTAGGA